ncbi:hypothetical protein SAMN02787142_7529 [Burkholderia sp. WP9]|nr:hypothetical protein SAMN02787142_7529 [Burkholderia sp. WP9]
MGIALAGVVFRTALRNDSAHVLVSRIFDRMAQQLEAPDSEGFDIRSSRDVMVQFFGSVCFVFSGDLVWELLVKPSREAEPLISATDSPDLLLAFCNYESGGSFGYAFFERGLRTRTRLQTTDVLGLPPILESGRPKKFEVRCLNSPTYLEEDDCPPDQWQRIYRLNDGRLNMPERYLTQHMLHEALAMNFDICPWETDAHSETSFFRLLPT